MIRKFIAYTVGVVALMCIGIPSSICAQDTVNIPDANFKSALVNNTVINTNGDDEIQTLEAEAFTGLLNVSLNNIADLTGIEAFTSITGLYCFGNQLTSLDLSANLGIERDGRARTILSSPLAVIPNGTAFSFPKQPVLGGVGGNPWIWTQFQNGNGSLTSDEILLGRCEQLSKAVN